MKDSIDKRFITPEFLLEYFPYRNRFHCPFNRGLSYSEEIYIKYKTELNQKRAKSGKPPLSDADLKEVIKDYRKTSQDS